MGMKALPKKLLPLILIGVAVTSLSFVHPAQAYTVRLQQMGANVVATGSGAINLTGLNFVTNTFGILGGAVQASEGLLSMGPNAAPVTVYIGFTGPTNFGSGG